MLMSMLSWLLCILVVASPIYGSSKTTVDIFILGGQSNMAGRGNIKEGKWFFKPNPSILRLSKNLQWEEAREPLHADIDVNKTCGIGPGLAFANEIVRIKGGYGNNNNVLGLVPCAVGGTKIDEWSKGSELYNELVKRAMNSVNGGGRIRAVLWYQGESDTVRKEDAVGYKHKMENFIMDIREDLHLPSLLIIQVALASGEGKFIEKVRDAQLGITLPNVKCVDAKGLRLKDDQLHLTTMSQLHLGLRLAHAYLNSTIHLFNNTNII